MRHLFILQRMYEPAYKPLLSRSAFVQRLLRQLLLVIALIAISLVAGAAGYHVLENYTWVDSFLNASMLLGGMGEVNELKTDGGKIFASIYALYSQLFMLICGGLMLLPVLHRLIHHFHSSKGDKPTVH
jgi:TRAP-type C4-dicarboxylate transport system permease small subunit